MQKMPFFNVFYSLFASFLTKKRPVLGAYAPIKRLSAPIKKAINYLIKLTFLSFMIAVDCKTNFINFINGIKKYPENN